MGLNSLALGFRVDFFTWLKDKNHHFNMRRLIQTGGGQSVWVCETHSATPSVRSVVSDLASSVPGVLAGCGAAGECLSEAAAEAPAAVAPGVVVVSLAGSSAGAGEG